MIDCNIASYVATWLSKALQNNYIYGFDLIKKSDSEV